MGDNYEAQYRELRDVTDKYVASQHEEPLQVPPSSSSQAAADLLSKTGEGVQAGLVKLGEFGTRLQSEVIEPIAELATGGIMEPEQAGEAAQLATGLPREEEGKEPGVLEGILTGLAALPVVGGVFGKGAKPVSKVLAASSKTVEAAAKATKIAEEAAAAMEGFTEAVTKQRRGPVLHDAEVMALADQSRLDMSALLDLPPGTVLNVENTRKALHVYKAHGRGMFNAAEEVLANPQDKEAVKAMFRSLTEMQGATVKMTGLFAEPGRTMRELAENVPGASGRTAPAVESEVERIRISDQFVNQMYDFFAKLEQETALFPAPFTPSKLAHMILSLETPEAMARFAKAVSKPGWQDAFTELWLNGILSGLAVVKNVISTPLIIGGQIVNRTAAAGIDAVGVGMVRWLSDTPMQRSVYFGEVPALLNGLTENWGDALRTAWKAFRENQPQMGGRSFEEYRPSATSEWLEMTGPMGRALDYMVTLPGRMLVGPDEWYKALAYQGEARALALRKAYQVVQEEGLTGTQAANRIQAIKRQVLANTEAFPEIHEGAQTFARYVTLQQELGEAGKLVQHWAGGTQINDFPIGRFLIPFTTIPANVPKMAGEHSLLAIFGRGVQEEIAAGGARADIALAKIGTGTMMAALMAGMATNGLITGNGPRDKQAREMKHAATGWQPLSFWDPVGQQYVSYAGMDPFTTVMGTVADMVDMLSNSPNAETLEKVQDGITALVLSMSKNVLSKAYLTGMVGTLNAVLSGDITTWQDWSRRMYPALILPYSGALRQVRGGVDPTMREVTDYTSALMNSIPGLSDRLPGHRNAWGQVQIRDGAVGPDWFNPFYVSAGVEDPVSTRLMQQGVVFNPIGDRIGAVQLSAWEHDKLQQLATDGLYDEIKHNVTDQQLSPLETYRITHAIVSNHHAQAQREIVNEPGMEALRAKLEAAQALTDKGELLAPSPYLPAKPPRWIFERRLRGIEVNP